MEWTQRAKTELDLWPRSWFGTLTFAPQVHAAALMAAIGSASMKLGDFHGLKREERFIAVHRVLSKQVTSWLKRVRKEAKTRFRYIVVAEYHTQKLDGLPHYHCLIHELPGQPPVRKAVLKRQWQDNGFSRWKLVEETEQAASYACKYLSKEAAARVRSSSFYGHPWDALAAHDQPPEGIATMNGEREIPLTLDKDAAAPRLGSGAMPATPAKKRVSEMSEDISSTLDRKARPCEVCPF